MDVDKNIPKGNFGERLRRLSEARGLDQASLAEQLKVSQASVSRYFNGRVPRGEVLAALSALFGVSPQELVGMNHEIGTGGGGGNVELQIAVGRLERLQQFDPELFESIALLLERTQTD